MNTQESGNRRHGLAGFTLIELLVVIAVIAILAALIIPVTGAVNRMKLRTRTKGELKVIENAIENYKTKHGFYPPDNIVQNDFHYINQLYYELSGTTNNGNVYTTLDRKNSINANAIPGALGNSAINGFMNTMQSKAADEGIIADNFFKGNEPPIGQLASGLVILVGSVGWPANTAGEVWPNLPANSAKTLNPFRYISTNPTNNPKSFDLWIDIIVGNKTNRISNWDENYKTL